MALSSGRFPPGARPSKLRAVVIATSSLVAALALAEVGFRVRAWVLNSQAIERALSEIAPPSTDPRAGLANIIRLGSSESIAYELQPNLVDRTFRGITVTTDENGFRVPSSRAATVPADAVTIVGIGDSIMFGDGVRDDETFMSVLQVLLDERYPATAWRVVNAAVPGYNTEMEVATLRVKALGLRPSLVILNVVSNDFAPPKFARRVEDPFSLRKSFLYEFAEERLGRTSLTGGEEDHFQKVLRVGERKGGEGFTYPRERWLQFSRPIGIAAYRAAMEELAELSRTHGFDVLVFSTYAHENIEIMMEGAAALGFPCFNMTDELDAWLLRETGEGFSEEAYGNSKLVVSTLNFHPSALQHRMVAERLLRELVDRGLLERYARGE